MAGLHVFESTDWSNFTVITVGQLAAVFEEVDWSNLTVGLAAVGLAFWAMKYWGPSERKAYQVLLAADREASKLAQETFINSLTEIRETVAVEAAARREERAQERIDLRAERAEERAALQRVVTSMVAALARAGQLDVNNDRT